MHIHQEARQEIDYQFKEVTFEQVLPIWQTELWPDRLTKISPMSSMLYLGGTDMSIYDKYEPVFFAHTVQGVVVSCNSGHPTSEKSYRSRGLYVHPSHRGNGLAKELLHATCERAKDFGASYIWTIPRQSSLMAYTSVGFEKKSDWFNEGVEFGPNCYCKLRL